MCHDFHGSRHGWIRRTTWTGLSDEDWSGGLCGMRSDPGKAWAWDQCRGVATDSGKFAVEDECGYNGARSVDHLEGRTCRPRR